MEPQAGRITGEAEGLLRYENAADARLMTIEFANLRNAVFDRVPATTLRVHGTPTVQPSNKKPEVETEGNVATSPSTSSDRFFV